MNNITVLLHKEWREFKQQRALLLSIIFIPLLLTMIPLVALFAIGHTPSKSDLDEFSELVARANPALAGMGQAELGQAFSSMFLLLPMILPSIIASYSIVILWVSATRHRSRPSGRLLNDICDYQIPV
jgi:ABC-2 type transport system permease protein